jgi:heme exporter protein B
VAEIVILVGFSLVYGWPVDSWGILLTMILGTLGIVSVGILAAAFVIDKRGRELLLPLMVLPVIIPVIALAGQLTSLALTQPMTAEWGLVIVLLVGYDLITVLGGAAAFSLITELY